MLDEQRLKRIGEVLRALSDGGYDGEAGYKQQELAFFALCAIPELLIEVERLRRIIGLDVLSTSSPASVSVDGLFNPERSRPAEAKVTTATAPTSRGTNSKKRARRVKGEALSE